LTIYVLGEGVCRRAAQLLAGLGYETVTGKVVE
jgi:hypothetical protein